VFLPLGLTLPVLETTRLWVFRSSYSLIDTVRALVEEGEWALGLLIALFSVVTPVIKLVAVTVLHLRRAGSPAGPLARWVERLGKWSLTDVLVVALLIVLASGTGLELAAEPGLWFFTASAMLLMLSADLVIRDLQRC
jgi:paraquat-inducible protein A